MSVGEHQVRHSHAFVMPAHDDPSDRLFFCVLLLVLGCLLGFAFKLSHVKVPEIPLDVAAQMVRARFVIEQKKAPPVKPKTVEKAKEEAPVDLTKKTLMNQKQDDVRPPTNQPEVRRVYGLRRVFAVGIGAGGSAANAVIGKLGNTLNKDIDTVTATPKDIKGEVVSVTTITTAPSFRKVAKPEYTKEMHDNKVEGVVKVKVLVDIDGRVKKSIALNDLGFGSAAAAEKACYEMEFDPAKRGETPVAVWIIVSIKFVVLGG